MDTTNKDTVKAFLDTIWNKLEFSEMDRFLSPDFTDHSLPPVLPPGREGTKCWILATGRSFEHNTIIEELVAEQNKVIVKLSMRLKHIGEWRSIAATGKTLQIGGFRFFRLVDGRIVEHHALIDGESIERELREGLLSCAVKH